MKFAMKSFIFLWIILMTFSGCSNVALKLYGIKSLKAVDDATILKYGSKFNIPSKDSYKVDNTKPLVTSNHTKSILLFFPTFNNFPQGNNF